MSWQLNQVTCLAGQNIITSDVQLSGLEEEADQVDAYNSQQRSIGLHRSLVHLQRAYTNLLIIVITTIYII